MDIQNPIQSRKNDHIRINLKADVASGFTTGLEIYTLEHCALPEFDLKVIDTSCKVLGHTLHLPLLISSMTGGSEDGKKVNRHLAEAAQKKGIAMGLGSQRPMLEHPELADTFEVRKFAPDILLLGNIGAVQFNYGLSVNQCRKLVEAVGADGLILHLNPLQEAVQPEGETNFTGLLKKINELCRSVTFPVIVKEVGWGLSAKVARQLIDSGVSALDVAGAGGTSWTQVEANRIDEEKAKRIALDFREWGIPTALSLLEVRRANKRIPVFASGGIRNGIEIAKCIALGANLCGMAGRLLHAATVSTEQVVAEIEVVERELRIAMFATGCKDIPSLMKCKVIDTHANG
jgi:isopentenyl-diphosphate Delta-isomerase